MKKCPSCARVYNDESFDYCLDDGAVLVYGPANSEPLTEILDQPLERATPLQPTSTTDQSQPLASHRLTIIFTGIALIAVLGFVGYRYLIPSGGSQFQSIAVMPFINESGDADIDYLSDGITESLIGSLSQIPNLSVKARSSVFRFKGKDVDSQTIGTQLGVQALLTGHLVKHGDELRLSLELVDARTGNRSWGSQYSRKMSDLLSLQSDIAQDVSQTLRNKLTATQQQRLAKNYTSNVEAYQLYLRGKYNLFKLTPDGIKSGIAYFQQAIELDPTYALAYVGQAAAYRAIVLSTDMPPDEFFPKSRAAAQQAIALDDSLAEAHAVLGFTLMFYYWDWATSESEFKRAIELNPNSADAHWGYAHLLSNLGRHDEAIAEVKRALELDPLSSMIGASAGVYLIDAGRPDEGLQYLNKVLELDPNFWLAHLHAANAYCDKGQFDQAINEARRAKQLNPATSFPGAFLTYALAKSGKTNEARNELGQVLNPPSGRWVPPYHVALAYVGLGDVDQAMVWLNKGLEVHDPKMTFLKVDRKWLVLNNDSRYQAVLRRMSL